MEADKKEVQPVIGEFNDKPVIQIPLVDNASPENSWQWFTFGKSKAKAIVKFYDVIKKFAEE
ncbi:MAG: hypothetical protein Q8K98_05445 [Bacteroidota bacterium]|nr:hypothetical protein [Bacteroidota bacterium]